MLAWLFLGVGMDDVGIADVDDADLGPQIGHVVLVVIGPGMAEGEQGRGLADRPRAEAGAGAELGAEVEGRAQDRDIGVDRDQSADRAACRKVEMPTKGRFSRPVS
jgi:hypothetical protein